MIMIGGVSELIVPIWDKKGKKSQVNLQLGATVDKLKPSPKSQLSHNIKLYRPKSQS